MATTQKNIVLQKKIGNEIVDVMPKTIGEIVYVSDPIANKATANSSTNDAVLNTVLEDINNVADLGIKTVEYVDGEINFYTEESSNVTSGTTTPAFTINVPKEQFLDSTETQFYAEYDKDSADATKHNFSNKNDLDGKPVLVLGVKTFAENGNSSIAYTPINLDSLINTYTGKAADTTNPIGISVDASTGEISGSIAIQSADNALKINASGELYVEDLTIANGTEGGIVVQDASGKLVDGGITLTEAGNTALNNRFKAASIVGALNELNQEVNFGADGQIKLQEDIPGVDDQGDPVVYDYHFQLTMLMVQMLKILLRLRKEQK